MKADPDHEISHPMANHEAALNQRIRDIEDLLRSACAIAERQGAGTAWDRFLASANKLGLNGITARTYRVLPHEMANTVVTHAETSPRTHGESRPR